MPTNGVMTERSLFMPALTLWSRDWIVERFEHAPHVADGTRRSARAVGDVVERLYRHVAAIAVFPERGKQRREFLLALAPGPGDSDRSAARGRSPPAAASGPPARPA